MSLKKNGRCNIVHQILKKGKKKRKEKQNKKQFFSAYFYAPPATLLDIIPLVIVPVLRGSLGW